MSELQAKKQSLVAAIAAKKQPYAAADAAWQAELVRLFGRNAGDVRYTDRATSGPTLAPLYAEVCRTRDAWHEAWDAWLEAMKEPTS